MHDSEAVTTCTRIAHRGYAGAMPENTTAAAAATADSDPDFVEVDVQPTADGTVVCFHDDHLHDAGRSRGITDETGAVRETPTESVCAATVLDSGETVPTLASFLTHVPAGVGVNVELKAPGHTDLRFGRAVDAAERASARARWQPFVDDVVAHLDTFPGKILVSSFYEGAIAATTERAPSLDTAVIVWDSLADGLTVANRYDTAAIHPPVNLVADTPYTGTDGPHGEAPPVTRDVVAEAGDRDVNVWTVRTWHEAMTLERAGVDGLILDYPGLVPT
jgi:glycerophosphoryl diester phosphodiesterase